MDLHFILGGALVGFIVGATGVGGGSLMTPLLTLVFNVPAQIAVGTDLLFASLTKASGALAHARRGNVNWSVTGWLVAGSVPAAVATLAAVHVLKPDAAVFAEVVKRTLGVALFLTAGALVFRAQVQALGQRFAGRSERVLSFAAASSAGPIRITEERVSRPLPTMVVGLVIGTLVTLTSVGAGVIGVVALFFLYPLLPARQIVGSDIAHAVPLTLVAGLGHVSLGNVNWSMLGMLLIGSLPAIHLGAAVAHRLPERALRIALATMLIGIGARLVLA
ncbi:MAG TPA: sulfite exporter TauE/SafE family protein [Burkholderiaceae bacterium]|nr:sulfite exporter TauE/SafE family protein [Burkholderiaceae bacterium]